MPQQYTLGIDQTHNQGIREDFLITPDNKFGDYSSSVGRAHPAFFLPELRFSEVKRAAVVISSQVPVARCMGWLVPAGYAIEAATYATNLATSVAAADAAATYKYSLVDVKNKVKNAKDVLVTVGEPVVKSFFTGTVQDVFVSAWCGIVNYDCFRFAGGNGNSLNPTLYTQVNFNPQSMVTYHTNYVYEFPLVVDTATAAAAPLTGIASAVGTTFAPGMFVTYDVASNYVITAADYTYGTVKPEYVLGQINEVFILKNATTGSVIQPIGNLNKVITPENFSGNILNELPGVRTDGMTQKITYSNGYGLVRIAIRR